MSSLNDKDPYFIEKPPEEMLFSSHTPIKMSHNLQNDIQSFEKSVFN